MKMIDITPTKILHMIATTSLAICAVLAAPISIAQNFPSHPITLIVGYPPGGSNDIIARLIAPHLGEILGTTVVVENRAGANGTIGTNAVIKAAPDGYTLLASSISPIILTPQTMKKSPFNVTKDLVAINMVGATPEVIAVGPNLKSIKTLKELIELSKTKPVTLSSAGTGGLPHLTIELLIEASKGKIMHVPYKGAGPAMTDTVGGHVDGIVMDLTPLFGMIKDGRLQALALTSEKRAEFLPEVPTAQEYLPKFNVINWLGIFAPAQTPEPIVTKISDALIKVVARRNVREQLEKVAVFPESMTSPAVFQTFVNQEYKRWGDVLKQVNVELTD